MLKLDIEHQTIYFCGVEVEGGIVAALPPGVLNDGAVFRAVVKPDTGAGLPIRDRVRETERNLAWMYFLRFTNYP